MDRQFLVSIVIRNYNYGRFLRRCIDSALSQTYPFVEIVVVDDGSTDHSRDIISAYGDRLSAIFQKNGGEESSCLSGFRASSGEIIVFLDADDMLRPHAIDAVVDVWIEGTAKVQYYLDWIDEKDSLLGRRWPDLEMPHSDVMHFVRIYGFYPSPPTTGNAFARSFLDKVLPTSNGPWPKAIDTYLIALAPLYGKVTSIHRSLGFYRVHGKNMSGVGDVVDLARLRYRSCILAQAEEALQDHAARLSSPLRSSLVLNIPSHCRARLLSLLTDGPGHPFPEDTVWGLVTAGVRSSWRYPHLSLWKRFYFTVAFPVFPFLPRPWLSRNLSFFVDPRARAMWLRRFRGHRATPA